MTPVVLSFASILAVTGLLPLPEAWAPFERSEPARRETEALSFDYRTGNYWSPSKETYLWAELVSGDRSVLICGTDRRISGMWEGGAGFGHLPVSVGKNELRKFGARYLGEARFIVKQAKRPWNERWPEDSFRIDGAAQTFIWSRTWQTGGTNGVFVYSSKPDGPGCARIDWDVGVDQATWQRLGLSRVIEIRGFPKEVTDVVAVTMTPPAAQGTIRIDFGETTALKRPPLPKTGDIDFWRTDAYDVPQRPGRNLLANGGFEQGLKGWRFLSAGQYGDTAEKDGVRYTKVTQDAKFGRLALHAFSPTNGSICGFASAPMALVPGRKHVVSFWARREKGAGGSVTVKAVPAGRLAKVPLVDGKEPCCGLSLTSEWQRGSFVFIAPEQGTELKVWVGGNDIYLDGFMVEEGTVAGETCTDPVEAQLLTSDPMNYIRKGMPINARLRLQGEPGLQGMLAVSVVNACHETIWRKGLEFALDDRGESVVSLDGLDGSVAGTGVFAVRLAYGVGPRQWRDWVRFSVIDPLDGTHPSASFFMQAPWFSNALYGCPIPNDFAADMAGRMRDWGFGATTWVATSKYAQGKFRDWYRRYHIVNRVHGLTADLETRHPERFSWGKPGFRAFTNATPEEVSFIENEAYESARTASPDDCYWTLYNEEEIAHPLIMKHRDFDRYFKFQHACWRGLKRGFDERGLKFYFAPTHGTAAYSHPSSYKIIDGYLEAAARQGFRYDFVSVHMYYAVDGSVLGKGDRDQATEYLVSRLKHYGYPDTTPIFFPEGYNMLPMHIPAWGACDWGDGYSGTIPSQSFSNRETLQAGVMARLYLMDLKRYPRLMGVHTWQHKPHFDMLLTPYVFPFAVNTIGRLLPDPRFIGDVNLGGAVRGYCFRRRPDSAECVLAVWTSDNDVENGVKKGGTLALGLPRDVRFVDYMGNERTPSPTQRDGGKTLVPLAPYPLYILSSDGEGLLSAMRATDGANRLRAVRTVRQFPVAESDSVAAGEGIELKTTRGSLKAALRLAWKGDVLRLRIEAEGVKGPQAEISFDGLGDGPERGDTLLGPDDCAFKIRGGAISRTKETETQFRDGGSTGAVLTDEEIDRSLIRQWTPTDNGGVWELGLTSRFISPVRVEKGSSFGLNVVVEGAGMRAELAEEDRPLCFPKFELK